MTDKNDFEKLEKLFDECRMKWIETRNIFDPLNPGYQRADGIAAGFSMVGSIMNLCLLYGVDEAIRKYKEENK